MAAQTPSPDSWECSYLAAFLSNSLAFVIERQQLRWLTWGFFYLPLEKVPMKANSWVHSLSPGRGNLIKRRETRWVVFFFPEQIMGGSGYVWTSMLTFVPRLQVGEMLARDLRLDLPSQSQAKSRACEHSCLVVMGFRTCYPQNVAPWHTE